jgi:hypothetical protein
MQRYRGQWLPGPEVERLQHANRQAEQAQRRWKPILAEWRRQIEQGDSSQREDALRRLRDVRDPEAFRVMETVLSEHSREIGLAVVELLGRDPRQKATESLLRHAVWCKFAEVREAACEELKQRPRYNYVPLLLDTMVSPPEVTIEHPTGERNIGRRTVRASTPDFDVVWVHEWCERRFSIVLNRLPAVVPARVPRQPCSSRPQTFREANTANTRLNDRIRTVLCRTTGESYDEAEEWWDWWKRYNEYEQPEEKPTYVYWSGSRSYLANVRRMTGPNSCLAWGTPIWTQTGLSPVQRIRVGDKVLSQDPDTGSLCYRPVLQTTIRRPTGMLAIMVDGEPVTVTLGHPFWVVGEGWRMAKHLLAGDRIWCLGGSREVGDIRPQPEDSAYNLVVEGYGTYFVGKNRILLHDNTMPRPTAAIVPGLQPGGQVAANH